jgi:tRNA pseudouridine38-40 synthase
MPRYFIRLSYKGTKYAGWQIQDNAGSVQEKVNHALSVITGTEITTIGCGRTDTGVHAKVFYAHFDLPQPVEDDYKFVYQLNSVLPSDIAIAELIPVAENAHARFDATIRTYDYYISLVKDPFLKEYSMFGFVKPQIDLMNQACPYLLRHSDFSAFSKTHTQVKTNICSISIAEWNFKNDLLVFTISSDRFLRGMVRAIVGTMIDVGTGKILPAEIENILQSGDRGEAGTSVPAAGLFLSAVKYPFINAPAQNLFPA